MSRVFLKWGAGEQLNRSSKKKKRLKRPKKAELDQKIKEMLAGGLSAGDILEKLK